MQSIGSRNVSALLKVILIQFWAYISLFLLCDIGENTADEFEKIDIYHHCDWFKYPLTVQRTIPIVIINSQDSDAVEAFGNVSVNRDTFKKVSF